MPRVSSCFVIIQPDDLALLNSYYFLLPKYLIIYQPKLQADWAETRSSVPRPGSGWKLLRGDDCW